MGLRTRQYLGEAVTVMGVLQSLTRVMDKIQGLIGHTEGGTEHAVELSKGLESKGKELMRLAKSIRRGKTLWQKVRGY